ncbi:MAG: hypothetical protein VKK42_20600 [Lyngbya sp.]|nr:hypothetical protein [Lyngbya sp.]
MESKFTEEQVLAAPRLKFLDQNGDERYASPMGYDEEEEFFIIAPEDRPPEQWEQILITQILELFD